MSNVLGNNATFLIVNYNLPEAVDEIRDSLPNGRWVIVDNGSDIMPPHKSTNIYMSKNRYWISGLLRGLDSVDTEYVWIFTTSMGAVSCEMDALNEMLYIFALMSDAISVSPAWVGELTSPTHKAFAQTDESYHKSQLCSPAAMWRTEFIKSNLDPRLIYGWGSEFDLGYIAKQQGYSHYINDRVTVKIKEHNGYADGRRAEELSAINEKASRNMDEVLTEKYGVAWKELLGLNRLLNV